MNTWYDSTMEQLEEEMSNGWLTHEEFKNAVRDLNDEADEVGYDD